MSTSARFSTAGSTALLGHEAHVRDFERLAAEDQLGHAYLFFGDEGIGKFLFAVSLANLLERKRFEVGPWETLTDTLIVQCGEGQNSLGIEAVRAIRRFLSATPFHASRRTVIVREAERLTWEAESALLKIVEEPPSHALILMTARSPEALFPPLASRMTKVYFRRFSRAVLGELLARHFGVTEREAARCAARAFGRLGYALALTKEKTRDTKGKSETVLTERLESLILSRFERGVRSESEALAFLLSRFEAASRFNLNTRLQERAVSYTIDS
jgi:DNA polymerase-3 subunit delta'